MSAWSDKCDTEAVKFPVKHIATSKYSPPFSSSVASIKRTHRNIKPDGQKCRAWKMVVFSKSGSLRCIAFPNRHINQRSFAQSYLGMNTMQSSHSCTHQFCLCSSRWHTRWRPQANIIYQLDVCLQITAKCFFMRRQKRIQASWTACKALSVRGCVCSMLNLAH